jgi:hypothetical protein
MGPLSSQVAHGDIANEEPQIWIHAAPSGAMQLHLGGIGALVGVVFLEDGIDLSVHVVADLS